jgi:hypothetical protein
MKERDVRAILQRYAEFRQKMILTQFKEKPKALKSPCAVTKAHPNA